MKKKPEQHLEYHGITRKLGTNQSVLPPKRVTFRSAKKIIKFWLVFFFIKVSAVNIIILK